MVAIEFAFRWGGWFLLLILLFYFWVMKINNKRSVDRHHRFAGNAFLLLVVSPLDLTPKVVLMYCAENPPPRSNCGSSSFSLQHWGCPRHCMMLSEERLFQHISNPLQRHVSRRNVLSSSTNAGNKIIKVSDSVNGECLENRGEMNNLILKLIFRVDWGIYSEISFGLMMIGWEI